MKFPLLNRRAHLYLGLALMPWFLLYGISSFAFSHALVFDEWDRARNLPTWTKRIDQQYVLADPAPGDLRQTGRRILEDFQIRGSFGTYRPNPNELHVYVYMFLHSVQIKYYFDQRRITIEDRRFRFDHFLTGMHARGGFEQETAGDTAWAIFVDLVCVSLAVWAASGLYMWWRRPGPRTWGWIALAAGVCSFGAFLSLL